MIKHINLLRSIAFRIIVIVVFVFAFVAIILYARGYRLSPEDTTGSLHGITSSGIISVSASPKASKVYINGNLKGVTDLNVSLPPGEYDVDVTKEGYSSWKKHIKLKGEVVTTLDVLLFPKNPSLISLTNIGVVKAIPYHEGNKIIVFSQSGDTEKDGVYVFDADSKPLSFFTPLKIIILKKYLPQDVDLSKTDVTFSPDLQQAIFEFPTSTGSSYSYLFSLSDEVTQPFDISSSKDSLLNTWHTSKNQEAEKILETFPKQILPIATNNFSIISFSPDQTKMLYQAKADIELPPIITPPLIGSDQTQEERSLRKDQIYVYDKKEDKNYHISFTQSLAVSPTPSVTLYKLTPTVTSLSPTPGPEIISNKQFPVIWHSDSKHLTIEQNKNIVMLDYDGTNQQTIYSGPFKPGFFYITNSGKLYVLSNLNPENNKYGDLYEIGIQ
jgi:hypothetical protein